jgi:PQQ-dependent dehydrogenase (methanol/ethanol family)
MNWIIRSGLVLLALFAMGAWVAPVASAGDTSEKRIRNCPDSDWCTYNRDDAATRFSPLTQINKGNVAKLRPAWIHLPGMTTRGIQSTPIVMDGSLYYSTPYSRVHKLNAGTGERMWVFTPELNDMVVKRQTHGPYSRGMCVGDGKAYIGTLDGRVVGVNDGTGAADWDVRLVDSVKDTIGFTGPCTYANGTVVIGQQAGEWPVRGRIFGLDGKSGATKWTFYTVGGPEDPEAMKTWGGDSWKHGGGGGWQAGSYDAENKQMFWGTGNPNPLYDWGAENWMTTGARPGINLYVSSTVALDINTGKLNWYFQEVPHDPFDWDAAVGEYLQVEKGGKKLVVHPSKDGFVYVYDRKTGNVENIYPGIKSFNFATKVEAKAGQRWPELTNPFYPKEGKEDYLCPAIMGGYSWNNGAYNPKSGMHYRIANEWCIYLTVQRVEPITEPSAALIIGADFRGARPQDPGNPRKEGSDPMHAFLVARDPVSGKESWRVRYEEVAHSAVLATAGDLVFVGNAMGFLEARDAANGKLLWSFNNGAPHEGGIVSYSVGGKQYIAAAVGRGSLVMDGYDEWWPNTFGKKKFTTDTGAMVAFTLP